MHHAATHLSLIAEAVGKELRHSDLLQIDETPMHYLLLGTGRVQTGYLWMMRDPFSGAVYYQWQKRQVSQVSNRGLRLRRKDQRTRLQRHYPMRRLRLLRNSDEHYQGIQLGACLAHIRRKFLDDKSLKYLPWVSWFLRAIKAIYRIERRLRNTSAPPDLSRQKRPSYAKPIVEQP